MSELFINKGMASYIKKGFLYRNGVNGALFSEGLVLNILKDGGEVRGQSNGPEEILVSSEKEFFLNIECNPLSNLINDVKIINESELKDKSENSDDLLNIYLPLAKLDRKDNFSEGNFINGNFNYIRRNEEYPLLGYHKDNIMYCPSFLVKSPDDLIIELVKNEELSGDGDVVVIEFTGSLVYIEEGHENFYLDSFSLKRISKDEISFSSDFYLEDDSETISRLDKPKLNFSFTYPVAIISDGNWMACNAGNVKLNVRQNSFEYFKEKEEISEGCFSSNYERKVNVYIIPEFL